MKHLLILLISLLLLSSPLFGQSERPETIIIPVSSLGDVSEVRKQILHNTLTNELKKHFRIVPQEKYEQVLEQVFEELEFEECSEDTCIMRVQEMLQVENVFNLQIIGEGKDSQLNLKWITLDEKKNETDYCEGCNTKKLNDKVRGLVEKIVGVKKVFTDELVVQKIEKDKTKEMFVSVGESGTILTSPDGNSWTSRTSVTSEDLRGITYGNGLFVGVGESGITPTSSDGTSWDLRGTRTSVFLKGVTYGKGLFVGVGESGTVVTSPDGTTWTERNSGTSDHLNKVTYGNDTFVTVGYGIILTSSDGITWTERNSGTYLFDPKFLGVTYGNGLFVTVGWFGIIRTSSDGTSWTERNSGTSDYLRGVTYGNRLFVTVGDNGIIVTSPDGTTWTERTSGTSKRFRGVTYGNGLFVTVGKSGTIHTSIDGIYWSERTSWTERTSGTSETLYGVTYKE
jgi:hypothetical protein